MEERDFFVELCLIALSISKNIRFAGVVDNAGKLLTGRYRRDIDTPLFVSSTKSDVTKNLFYASSKSVVLTKTFEGSLGQLKYQMSEFEGVQLITIPLTIRGDRFLCVSLDPTPSCQKTVIKLMKNI